METNYIAQAGVDMLQKAKNTPLYCSQKCAKMCIRYEASQHCGDSKDTMEKERFARARLLICLKQSNSLRNWWSWDPKES